RLNPTRLLPDFGRDTPAFLPGLEFLERAAEPHRRREPILDDFGGLVAVPGDADHDRLIRRNGAALNQVDGGGQCRAAGRLREDTLRLGEELDGVDDLGVRDRRAAATRLPDAFDYLVPVGGVADRNRL